VVQSGPGRFGAQRLINKEEMLSRFPAGASGGQHRADVDIT